MKKQLWILLFAFTALTADTQAQTLPVGRLNKFYSSPTPDEAPSISKVKYSTLTGSLSFTSVTRTDSGWVVGNIISLGQSYIFASGNGTWNSDTSVDVEQQFFYGIGYNIGLVPANNSIDYGKTSVTVGAVFGWDKLGFFLGYDLVTKREIVGINVSIVGLPILQSLTKFQKLPN